MRHEATTALWISVLLIAIGTASTAHGEETGESPAVTTMRVPEGGIQPQVVVDHDGGIHMTYFKGDAHGGDIFYVKSTDGGRSFSSSIKVNSRPGSAVAVGTIRGAQLAVGRLGRAHVTWLGSSADGPEGSSHRLPALYTRLNDAQNAFEHDRDVIQKRPGLDAGPSVAADRSGNVYVVWHAPGDEGDGEQHRRVWVARSTDEGRTFSLEKRADSRPTGACVCCSLGAFADSNGKLHVLYRSANRVVNRDTYLLTSDDIGASFRGKKVHKWTVGQCVASTAALSQGPSGVLAAWETTRQIYFAAVDPESSEMGTPTSAPGRGPNRKYPALAANQRGDVLLAWTEGTSWGQGGTVAWQVFGKDGEPVADAAGRAEGLPAWSFVAAFARPHGGFTIVY